MVRNSRTGFVYHDDYLKHYTGHYHAENAGRLTAIVEHLKKTGLWDQLVHIAPYRADLEWIFKIHSKEYVEYVKEMCSMGTQVLDFGDTIVCGESYDVALLAAGGVLAAVDKVMDGTVRNAFCAVRPPGHHAEQDKAMGFCLFNNVAIGARYIQERYKLGKVAIIDWDVHHGNGTQHSFYDDPTVFYISLHEFPHYPGTGTDGEIGDGMGKGHTLNFPMRSHSTDADYLSIFEREVVPTLDSFRPDFILISAGFDPHRDDPLSSIMLTENAFTQMTRMLKRSAEKHCSSRIVSVIEGGYNFQALGLSVEAHLRELMADPLR